MPAVDAAVYAQTFNMVLLMLLLLLQLLPAFGWRLCGICECV